MTSEQQLQNMKSEILASFSAGLEAMELLVGNGFDVLNSRLAEQGTVRTQLRQHLAATISLRHRDFDAIMKPIFELQLKREAEIKQLMKDVLMQHKELMRCLKNTLESKVPPNFDELKRRFEAQLTAAEKKIRQFQQEQATIRRALTELEIPGNSVTVQTVQEKIKELEKELSHRNL